MLIFLMIVSTTATAVMFFIFKEKKHEWAATWAIVFGIIHGCLTTHWIQRQKPSALDVYRGKTTLEITYRDSVAVDSVVVYKMK